MPNVFTPRADTLLRLFVLGGLGSGAAGAGLIIFWPWTGYATEVDRVVNQPVPFSHAHHVGGLGLDCRYCHTSVETGAYAGMPPASTCLNCHQQLYTEAAVLTPVWAARLSEESIAWNRVHDLADYVQFNHAVHVNNGVGCVECHGRVDRMPLMWQEAPLTMSWCLECHREPEKRLRPREAVFEMDWHAPPGEEDRMGIELMHRFEIETLGLTRCTACHR